MPDIEATATKHYTESWSGLVSDMGLAKDCGGDDKYQAVFN